MSAEVRSEPARLGSYAIIRHLARGGMAELFLARANGHSDAVVVLKKILPKYAFSPKFVQLFLDEARLAVALAHPNIVEVYEVGNDRGDHFFAMEFLHGQDLRTVLHRAWQAGEQIPIAHAVAIGMQVAAALHHAHELGRADGTPIGVVHRDVSPSNIIVTYDGRVKLVDFGVAKASTSSTKTRTGTLKGKISYMSPEQARGSPLDRRSDIFSLGIVLWEMVTTHRLFRGENDLQTLQLIINEAPRRPSELRPACSPELERIILRALAQDVDARYPTAAELLHDLEAVARTEALEVGDSAPVAAYLDTLFGAELAAWHEARERGTPLAEHLEDVGDLTVPVSESEFIEAFDIDELLEEELHEDDLAELTEMMTPFAPLTGPTLALTPVPSLAPIEVAEEEPQPPAWANATPSHPFDAVHAWGPPLPGPLLPPAGVVVGFEWTTDAAAADRVLRRGLQVGAALLALVVLIAVITGLR